MSHMSDPMKQNFTAQRGEPEVGGAACPPASHRSQGGMGGVLAAVAAALISFAVGLTAGVFFMGLRGYSLTPPVEAGGAPPPGGSGPGGPGAGMPMMGAPPGMGGGRREKAQLAGLVNKLDVLTEKPLAVQLTSEQRKEIQDQLKGLADAEAISDDDAKAKLDKVLDVLKDHKETLEAAGYRWPGAGAGPGGPPGMGQPPPPNPFKTDANAKHLKALSERLDKAGNG